MNELTEKARVFLADNLNLVTVSETADGESSVAVVPIMTKFATEVVKAETQRLREANTVLMEVVGHYADRSRWMQSSYPNEFYGDDVYVGSPNGYDLAQAALDKAKEILGGD